MLFFTAAPECSSGSLHPHCLQLLCFRHLIGWPGSDGAWSGHETWHQYALRAVRGGDFHHHTLRLSHTHEYIHPKIPRDGECIRIVIYIRAALKGAVYLVVALRCPLPK